MNSIPLNPQWIEKFQTQLLNWYTLNQRQLPWRISCDPYAVWISEIMLQQTQVDTVVPYYNRFMAQLPTLKSLSQVEDAVLLKLWEGLGYYSRARNLKNAALKIVENHQSKIPSDYKALMALPGIGPYTAGAIMSIGFDQSFSAVDGNVVRVYSRVQEIGVLFSRPEDKKRFTALADALMPQHQPGNFNQALMELGALICTPKNPRCSECPISSLCMANQNHSQSQYPLKKPKLVKAVYPINVWIFRNNNLIFMLPPSEKRLLRGLWSLPTTDTTLGAIDIAFVVPPRCVGTVKHVFTHQVWQMTVLEGFVQTPESLSHLYPLGQWISADALQLHPISKAFQKALSLVHS